MADTTPIPATYLTASSCTVAADKTAQFIAGMKVQADCGVDGLQYGAVATASGTTVTLTMDSGALTANLTGVLHGNDTPQSLCNHGHTGQADGGLLTAVLASLPAHYARSALAGLAGADAVGRRSLALPGRITVNVNDAGYALSGLPAMDLNVAANWDTASPDYTNPANRAGKDISVYACVQADGTCKLLFSANATFPAGYTAATSRKIMGLHCLCAQVRHDLSLTARSSSTAVTQGTTRRAGTWDGRLYRCMTAGTTGSAEPTWSNYSVGSKITDGTVTWAVERHALEGYATGDILPASIWDLKHRSAGDQAGRVYCPAGGGCWVMIYLASVSGGRLVSVNGGTVVHGLSSPAFHWNKFSQWFGAQGERMVTATEFVALSVGSNQNSLVTGGAPSSGIDPVYTGGHLDTYGRRTISHIGCEDCCGVYWQWGEEMGPLSGSSSFTDNVSSIDSVDVWGQQTYVPSRLLFGGYYQNQPIFCGSRSVSGANSQLSLGNWGAARGVSAPLAVEI